MLCRGFESHLRELIFLRKSDCLGCAVLLCLVVYSTLLASFFLPSHLSLKHVSLHTPPLSPGLPPGVCNMVFGSGPRAGEAIVKHPSIPLISFTGSTAVGRRIQSVSAPFVKRLSLEVQSNT